MATKRVATRKLLNRGFGKARLGANAKKRAELAQKARDALIDAKEAIATLQDALDDWADVQKPEERIDDPTFDEVYDKLEDLVFLVGAVDEFPVKDRR